MTKWLLLVAVVLGVLWWMRSAAGRGVAGKRASHPDQGKKPKGAAAPPPQAMVACKHCGVWLPAADALPETRGSGGHYCGEEHRRLGPVDAR